MNLARAIPSLIWKEAYSRVFNDVLSLCSLGCFVQLLALEGYSHVSHSKLKRKKKKQREYQPLLFYNRAGLLSCT